LRGWFWIDLIAIIPLDIIIVSCDSANEAARIARIARIYQLIRLARVFRVLRALQVHNIITWSDDGARVIKMRLGVERYVFMLIAYLILQHIFACMW
jgi:hypothetical protein